jgi:hypothetical protein
MVDTPTTVAAAPFVQTLEPYLVSAIGAVFTVLATWALTLVSKYTGIQVDSVMSERINRSAQNAANFVIASLDGPIGNVSIDVRSPLVAEGVRYMQQHVPDVIAAMGYTPETLAQIVMAKLGAAQVTGTATAKPVA